MYEVDVLTSTRFLLSDVIHTTAGVEFRTDFAVPASQITLASPVILPGCVNLLCRRGGLNSPVTFFVNSIFVLL